MDMVTVAAILGHSKLEMLRRYAHPQEDHKAEAMKKLAAANTASEIAEFEKLKVLTISHTEGNSASTEPTVN
jgi:hypothetical protein